MKGATRRVMDYKDLKFISIHAPVKGATLDYNQRLKLIEISIHAPVKGATAFVSSG